MPRGFSIERYLRNAWHLIPEPGADQEVVVRFQPLVARNVERGRSGTRRSRRSGARTARSISTSASRASTRFPGGFWATATRPKCSSRPVCDRSSRSGPAGCCNGITPTPDTSLIHSRFLDPRFCACYRRPAVTNRNANSPTAVSPPHADRIPMSWMRRRAQSARPGGRAASQMQQVRHGRRRAARDRACLAAGCLAAHAATIRAHAESSGHAAATGGGPEQNKLRRTPSPPRPAAPKAPPPPANPAPPAPPVLGGGLELVEKDDIDDLLDEAMAAPLSPLPVANPNPYRTPVADPAPPKKKRRSEGDDALTTLDIVLAIVCNNIACILAVIWIIQGKPKGLKMLGTSVLAFLICNGLVTALVVLSAALQRPVR